MLVNILFSASVALSVIQADGVADTRQAITDYDTQRSQVLERAVDESFLEPFPLDAYDANLEGLLANIDDKRLSDEELERVFYIVLTHAFDTEDDATVGKVLALYDQLGARGVSDASDTGYVHRLLVAMRRWKDADALWASSPEIDLPRRPGIQASARTEGVRYGYARSADGAWLREVPLWHESEDGTGLVVSVHPRCHFSRDALDAIRGDTVLAPMTSDAVFLLQPYTLVSDGAVAQWNAERPDQALRYAIHRQDWPEISYWGTPSFYFFKDGEVVKKVVGWRREEAEARKADLVEGFRLIGRMPQ